jgi:hypothetical protein
MSFVFTVVSTSQVNEKKHHCILHLKLGASKLTSKSWNCRAGRRDQGANRKTVVMEHIARERNRKTVKVYKKQIYAH